LERMGYEKPYTKLTFCKAFFLAQWKFLIHTILQCMSAKRIAWNEFSSSMASAVICLATGRIIALIDADEDVILEEVDAAKDTKVANDANVQGRLEESQAQVYHIDLERADKVLSMQDDEPEPAELKEVVIRDPEETATPSTIVHSEPKSKDKGKGILVEKPKPLKKQAQIEQDEAYARELEAEINKNINWDDVIKQNANPPSTFETPSQHSLAIDVELMLNSMRHQVNPLFHEHKYAAKILERAIMVNCNPSRSPVATESKLGDDGDPVSYPTSYRSLASSFQYLTFTHLYISYAMQQVYLYMHDHREPHFSVLKRFLSAKAEYRGVANAVDETCWLRNLLCELHTPLSSVTLVYYVNASVVYLSYNPV
nr:ribonuclease H-like domain-containing protein [Tanacetum cinerariifolium]